MSGQRTFGARLRGAWLRRASRVGLLAIGAWAAAFALGMYMRHPWSWLLSLSPILLGPALVLLCGARVRLELGPTVRHRGSWPGRDWAVPLEQVEAVELWPEETGVRVALSIFGDDQRVTEPLDPGQGEALRAAFEALGRPARGPEELRQKPPG